MKIPMNICILMIGLVNDVLEWFKNSEREMGKYFGTLKLFKLH